MFRSLRSRSLGLGATFLLCVVIFVSLEHTFRSPRAFSDLFVVCRAWLSTVKVGIGTIDCRAQPTAHGRHRWPRHILRSSAAPWRGLVCGVHLLAAAGLLLTMGRVICANGTLVWEDLTPASPVIQSRHCRSAPAGPSEPGLLALAVGSQSPGVGCRDAIGRRRACRARVREIRGATRPKRHYLKGRSVQPSTLARYEKCSQLLIVFCSSRRLIMHPMGMLDKAFEMYADHMFFLGHGVSDVRYAIWGYAFLNDIVIKKHIFPATYAALRGWQRAAPSRERGPMPWTAVVLISHELATNPAAPVGALHAARALPLQWDAYMRPCEVLSLRIADLIPSKRARSEWAVVVRSSDPHIEGSEADLRRAALGHAVRKPNKQGRHDGTVIVGDLPSREAGRGWIGTVVSRLRSLKGDKAFDIKYTAYARCLTWAAERLRLDHLHLTPHTARHGGPSSDAAERRRSIDEIQTRGLWECPQSVARYKKAGTYRRQEQQIPLAMHVRAAQLEKNLARLLFP